jgi:hypothetical protein
MPTAPQLRRTHFAVWGKGAARAAQRAEELLWWPAQLSIVRAGDGEGLYLPPSSAQVAVHDL